MPLTDSHSKNPRCLRHALLEIYQQSRVSRLGQVDRIRVCVHLELPVSFFDDRRVAARNAERHYSQRAVKGELSVLASESAADDPTGLWLDYVNLKTKLGAREPLTVAEISQKASRGVNLFLELYHPWSRAAKHYVKGSTTRFCVQAPLLFPHADDAGSRSAEASIGGIGLQTTRVCVEHFIRDGPEGMMTGKAKGREATAERNGQRDLQRLTNIPDGARSSVRSAMP